MTEHKAEVGMGGRRQWFDGSNMCQKVVDLWDLSILLFVFYTATQQVHLRESY